MKIVLNNQLLLKNVNTDHVNMLIMWFRVHNVNFNFTTADSTNRSDLYLTAGQTIELPDETMMKILLNTIDMHTTVRLKYVYLGNLKFDVVYDK